LSFFPFLFPTIPSHYSANAQLLAEAIAASPGNPRDQFVRSVEAVARVAAFAARKGLDQSAPKTNIPGVGSTTTALQYFLFVFVFFLQIIIFFMSKILEKNYTIL
jgi:hypothetical protein